MKPPALRHEKTRSGAATIGDPGASTGRSSSPTTTRPGPALYEREAARVRAILGDRVRLLEHAGSTSVPGLPAKPIIDMRPGRRGLGRRARLRPRRWRPPATCCGSASPTWHEHRLFKGPDTDINLHTFSAGSSEIDRMLAFRDRLRTHDDERERYLATKRELAARHWVYVQDYADAKGEVVEGIIARALAERRGTAPR